MAVGDSEINSPEVIHVCTLRSPAITLVECVEKVTLFFVSHLIILVLAQRKRGIDPSLTVGGVSMYHLATAALQTTLKLKGLKEQVFISLMNLCHLGCG